MARLNDRDHNTALGENEHLALYETTYGSRPLIRACFLFLTEIKARGVEMGGEKGTRTGQKIKTVFNLQLTTLNMPRKI